MSTITFAGNLAGEVETRFTPSGRQVARFTVLENRRKQDDSGKWVDLEPNAYRVQAWAGLAENIGNSLTTGDRVIVTGRIVTDRWTDKDSGEDRTAQHVVADEVGYSLKFHTVTATKAQSGQVQAQEPQTEEPPL